MKRKYFSTVSQTVLCEVIVKDVNNGHKNYKYYLVKLPVTFLHQTVELWHNKLNKGHRYVGAKDGSTCSIRIDKGDFKGIRKGDKILASFSLKESQYD